MTSDKNYSTEEENFNYYSVKGCYDLDNQKRMSPSSWDDTEEEVELTDTDSTLDNSDLKQTRFYDVSATNEALEEEEDRRQSSARVRRRKKDSTRSSLVSPETDVLSSAGNSFIAWDDQDTDRVIFDIEMYLNERNFSEISPERLGFIFHESGTSNRTNSHRLTKITEENKNLSNFNVRLSRIVEVDESKSSLSLGSADNSHFLMATINNSKGSRSNTDITYVKGFRGTVEEITPSGEKQGKIVSSSEDDVEIFTEDKKRAQNTIRSTIKKSFDDMCYRDTEYFDNTLTYFFEAEDSTEKVQKTRSRNYEEDGLYFGKQISKDYSGSTAKIEENELFQSFREVNSVEGRNDVGDKISIDKVEDVSNCTDTTHESGTPKRHGNLTGREKDHALSKESLELGLENPFSLTRQTSSVPLTSKNDLDMLLSDSYDLIQKNECFLKDVSLSNMDADTFSRLLTESDDSSPKSPLLSRIINTDGMAALPETSSCEYTDNYDSKGEVFFKFLRKNPSDSKSLFGNEPKVDEIDEGSIHNHNKPKSSFESNIILELDVSDKSSTTEMKVYGDSFSEMESPVNSESAKNNGKSPSSIIHKLSTTGKPSTTRSNGRDDSSISNQNQISLSKHKFGFGDLGITERNPVRNTGENKDYPQDRGDMKFESYSVKSEWGRLIVQLDEGCTIERPVKSIFRVDVQENLKANKSKCYTDKNVKPVKSFVRFSKRRAKGRGGKCKITKAKKRKRETAFADDADFTGVTPNLSNNTNQIIKKNWLVNTLTNKRRVLRRRTGSLKTFLIMRGRRQNRKKRSYRHQDRKSHFTDSTTRGADCFRSLFKQLVNFFTVFCHKNRD